MVVFGQVMFMDMDRGWSNFYQFVVIDEFQSLFQGYFNWWNQNCGFVSIRCMYVGQFFIGQVVYCQVVGMVVNIDDLVFVNFSVVVEEQFIVILQIEQCECYCFILIVGDQYVVVMLVYFVWMNVVVVVEGGVKQIGIGGYGYEF